VSVNVSTPTGEALVRVPRRRALVPRAPSAERTVPRVFETLMVFLLSAGVYALLGAQVVTGDHVVVFEALDRLTRAYMVWHNSPPKLAAVGFTYPPLTSLIFLPFTLVKPLATSLIALPLTSAIFAGATLAVLNRTLELCQLSALLRYPLLALFGLNPEFVFYATNGMPDTAYLFLLAGALYCLIRWYLEEESRYLIGAGVAFTCCMLTRYEFIIWAFAASFVIGAALVRREATRARIEGSVIAYLAPIVYGLALWTLFNGVIVGRPFEWLSSGSSSSLAIDSDQVANHGSVALAEVAHRLLELTASSAPLALVAIPVLVYAFVRTRDVMSLGLASFLALGLVIVGADALIQNDLGVLQLQNGLPLALTALLGAAWLFRSQEAARMPVWLVTLAVLAVGIPLAWNAMEHYPFQNLEQAFARAVKTGQSQEGTSSIGGFTVGIEPERQMAAYIDHTVGKQRHAILTDNAQTYGVIMLSGRPQDFNNRVNQGDGPWYEAREDPYGKVKYMLVAYRSPGDLIRQRYPEAASGGNPNLTPVFHTSRYVLLRVARPPATSKQAAGEDQPVPSITNQTTP
jgi:4-amino-4-deoxy-L-arabinose transferase-like glycosyltransferase